MKLLIKFYVSLVVIFMAAKLCFMAFNVAPDGAVSAADALSVLLHGLPLDLATAGYFAAPIWLFLLLRIWLPMNRIGWARTATINRRGQFGHHIYYVRARMRNIKVSLRTLRLLPFLLERTPYSHVASNVRYVTHQ